TIHQSGNNEFDREKRNFSLTKLIASQLEPSIDASREREICQEQRRLTGKKGEGSLIPFECLTPQLEKRVLTYAGDGSNLVSTQVMESEFISALQPLSVATILGARVLTGLMSDIALPRQDARTPTGAWFAENGAINTADMSLDQVTGTAKHYGCITSFGRKTMISATPGVEQIARQLLMANIAAGLDLAVLKGGGGSAPTGITATTGIHTKSSSSANPTYAEVLDVVARVKNSNVPMTNLGWALNAFAEAKFKSITKVSSDAGAGFLMDDDGRLGGSPSAVSSQLLGNPDPTAVDSEVIYGDWSQVIVGMWNGVEILINPYEADAYSKGNVWVRAIVDADVLVRHPEAFAHWEDIKSD
ncbi:MAG: phage major capsid protein, partial [Nitrospira sp.]|nr:phage major capsid protein [Nitrospira sp.]